MPTYALLIRNTSAGSSWTLNQGAGAVEARRQAAEHYGGRIVADQHYTTAGAYDGLLIVEFADEVGLLGLSQALGSWGQRVEALRCFGADELDRARGMAASAAERALEQLDDQPDPEAA